MSVRKEHFHLLNNFHFRFRFSYSNHSFQLYFHRFLKFMTFLFLFLFVFDLVLFRNHTFLKELIPIQRLIYLLKFPAFFLCIRIHLLNLNV